MSNFKLEGLRHYGPDTPIAVVRVQGNVALYDLAGIRDLIEKYRRTSEFSTLVAIERAMLIPGDYKDLQETDFSGQDDLF